MLLVFDVDGTLVDSAHRLVHISGPGKKDWGKYHSTEEMAKDSVLFEAQVAVESILLKTLACSTEPVLYSVLTGRDEVTTDLTKEQIKKWFPILFSHLELNGLWMFRPKGDRTPADVYKPKRLKVLKDLIVSKGLGNPGHTIVFDDDVRVFEPYRSMGAIVHRSPECWKGLL